MRIYLTILILLTVQLSFGRAFYVSSSGGNDGNNGLSIGAPWLTLAKVNAFAFSNNDTVLFKKGDVWYEELLVNHDYMNFGAYGTGVKPLFSGLQTLTSWTNDGAGIQHSTASINKSNIVVIDGYPYAMGRYPNPTASNSGYLIISAKTSNSITGPANSSTTDWSINSGVVVIRKNHWIIDPCPITAHSGGTITYSGGSSYSSAVGYGYFIQNDIRTLDVFGEWYLNNSTNNLSVYFGADLPSNHTVKIGVQDTIFNMRNKNFITVDGIAIEGATAYGFYNQFGQTIVVKNCKTTNCTMGILLNIVATAGTIQGDTIINSLSRGVALSVQTGGTQYIGYNYIKNTLPFPGMSSAGDGYGDALDQTSGDNATIEYNRIDSTGYIPIVWGGLAGNNINVHHNYVTNYCYIKDDGGGIYTGNGFTNTTSTNRNVYNNIISNGIGADNGTSNYPTPQNYNAHGIYIDAHSFGNYVHDNTILNCLKGTGVFLHIANNTTVSNNTSYNTLFGVDIGRLDKRIDKYNRNIIYTGNINYSNYSNLLYFNQYLDSPNVTPMVTDLRNIFTRIDSNYYRSGITYPFNYSSQVPYNAITFQDLPAWKTTIAGEANSSYMSTGTNQIFFNAVNGSYAVNFDGYQKTDVYGTVYNDFTYLSPYSSIVLFNNGASPVMTMTIGSSQSITAPTTTTSLTGSATGGMTIVYAWTQASGPSTASFSNPNSNNTQATGLIPGVYLFRLTATSGRGTVTNTQQVTVIGTVSTIFILKHRYIH